MKSAKHRKYRINVANAENRKWLKNSIESNEGANLAMAAKEMAKISENGINGNGSIAKMA